MDDAVVIGAGPNGLVAANQLADHGWDVSVLEAAPEPGGAVRSAEITEPGFRHDLYSAFYPLVAASPLLRRLHLEEYGLRWRHAPLALAHPLPDGSSAVLSRDLDVTAASVERFAVGDGRAWRAMMAHWDHIADPFVDVMFRPFPPVSPAARVAAKLGALGTVRFLRHLALPVRRMAEETYRGEGARLLLGGSALHADVSPEAAGSGLFGWLLACLGQRYGFPVPRGGAKALTDALVRRLSARGGSLTCGTRAVEVLVRGGRAVAVRTADGGLHRARRAVIADVAVPSLYEELLHPRHVPASVLDDVRRFQWDTSTVKVDWALDAPIPWHAAEARRAGTVHVADDFDNLTESAAHIAMGLLPSRPFLVVGQQSISDPSRSPPGTETAWAYTHVPQRLRGDAKGVLDVGHGEPSWIDGFVERMELRIEHLANGFGALVRGRHVLTPSGLQAANPNLHGGSISGGTSQLHQLLLFRPIPGSGRAETPIAGLYLASAAAHPGGGVHGAAGATAARAATLWAPRPRAFLFGRGWSARS